MGSFFYTPLLRSLWGHQPGLLRGVGCAAVAQGSRWDCGLHGPGAALIPGSATGVVQGNLLLHTSGTSAVAGRWR